MIPPWLSTLGNGTRLLVVHNPIVPIMAIHVGFGRGSAIFPRDKAGLGSLLAAVLTKGTSAYTSQEIATLIADWGARLSIDINPDSTEITAKCAEEDFVPLLELLAAVVQSPTFPEAEVEREQILLLQAIQSRQEQVVASLYERVCAHLYGEHPYAQPPLGSVETISALTREDLVWGHHQLFHPQQMVITVVGSLTPTQIQAELERTFGGWDPEPVAVAPFPPIAPVPPACLTVPQASQQTTVMLAYLGCSVLSPDFLPLSLLMHYLGNGLSSRLFQELREKRGLAYEVSAFLGMRRDRAPFVVYAGTTTPHEALTTLHAEMALLCQEPLTEPTWVSVQKKVLGQYLLGQQTTLQIAQRLGWYELIGLGYQFAEDYPRRLREITPQMAWRVAQNYLHNPTIALAGSPHTLAIVSME